MTSRLKARVSGLEEQRNLQMQCCELSTEELARHIIFTLHRIKHGHTQNDNLLELLRRNTTFGTRLDQFMSEV
jgi:hypothetical protein